MMNLQLYREDVAEGAPVFYLLVTTDLDAGQYVPDGSDGIAIAHPNGEKSVTVYFKEKEAPTDPTNSSLAYWVRLGDRNPVEDADSYLVVRLRQRNGTEHETMRLAAGDGGTQILPITSTRPLEMEPQNWNRTQ